VKSWATTGSRWVPGQRVRDPQFAVRTGVVAARCVGTRAGQHEQLSALTEQVGQVCWLALLWAAGVLVRDVGDR
jgi:hypothetical protein